MKHGVAFRKFSRTSSHRNLMLRNLVSSLFQHEQISTTLPKARDAARLAEKIITLGKQGHESARSRASAFLLQDSLVPKLFTTFAQRYANRPGGYTRIHKLGNRPGDNAPRAILELVDNPHDLRFEMTSRAIGFDMLREKLKSEEPVSIVNNPKAGVQEVLESERHASLTDPRGALRPKTRWNLQKILRYRNKDAVGQLTEKAVDHMDRLLATPVVYQSVMKEGQTAEAPKDEAEKKQQKEAARWSAATPRHKAGAKLPGDTRPALSIAQGSLGHQRSGPSGTVLSTKTVFSRKQKSTS